MNLIVVSIVFNSSVTIVSVFLPDDRGNVHSEKYTLLHGQHVLQSLTVYQDFNSSVTIVSVFLPDDRGNVHSEKYTNIFSKRKAEVMLFVLNDSSDIGL
ncbi:hypothetical protein T4A_216 [Trichinella pseudospiralis]|uniref:Uncharacterized protein n=1 Tax=Trichinella pseudospiralis TaxID=6337 RepID=A0A0V1DTP5_TRIPS|nr:hypothetical protein T4A_216 [Trichinella pseudospiralis]